MVFMVVVVRISKNKDADEVEENGPSIVPRFEQNQELSVGFSNDCCFEQTGVGTSLDEKEPVGLILL
jgi:hypothetical protein